MQQVSARASKKEIQRRSEKNGPAMVDEQVKRSWTKRLTVDSPEPWEDILDANGAIEAGLNLAADAEERRRVEASRGSC